MASATPAGKAAADTAPTGSVPASRAPIGRAVIWVGLALGTAVTVLAVLHGIRFPGLQVVVSVALMWLLLIVVAVTVAELLRRHHRPMARHAWRHSKRGALFAHHHARRGARSAGGYLAGKAAARWQDREHRPLMFTRKTAAQPAGDAPFIPVVLTARSKTGRVLNPVTGEPVATVLVKDPDDLKRRLAALARHPGIEVSTRPANGPGNNSNPPPERKTTMADTIINDGTKGGQRSGRIRPARRARHTATQTGGALPGEWGAVIARAADFEPDNDGELLGWMGDEVSGVAGYAEALVDLYESCTAGIGLDPVAMTALHDVADAAAHAAETMSGARGRFADHYELPREFAGNGGLMPHDGRWVTGDGDA